MRLIEITNNCGDGAVTLTFVCHNQEWQDSILENPNIDFRNLEINLCSGKRSFKKCKPKVIFNPPATILFMNGKKYVSKAHDEAFDEEKGLLMCLAKANGISHLELKRIIKGAKRQEVKDLILKNTATNK